jgi:hypothetical protein
LQLENPIRYPSFPFYSLNLAMAQKAFNGYADSAHGTWMEDQKLILFNVGSSLLRNDTQTRVLL